MDKNTSFKNAYEKYGNMLYRIAFVYLGNEHDTEDILQEVFISLLYKSPAFKSQEHEKAWLIRTTQNKCINFLKSNQMKTVSLDDAQIITKTQNNDLHMDIIKQIVSLPPKYKSAVILFYYNNYSVEEIAQILKITKSAVKMRLKRSREILKIQLEDYSYEEK